MMYYWCRNITFKVIFAAIGQTGYQNRKKNVEYLKIKKSLESIGALFSKISLIEPEIFKVKDWFQVKVPIPFSFWFSLIGVYGLYNTRDTGIVIFCKTSKRWLTHLGFGTRLMQLHAKMDSRVLNGLVVHHFKMSCAA